MQRRGKPAFRRDGASILGVRAPVRGLGFVPIWTLPATRGPIVTPPLQGSRPAVASLGHVDAMRMRDILSVPFGDVSERLARLVGLALRSDGVDVERVQTVSSGKPVYVGADSMVADVERALRSKDIRLLPVLDGVHLLGFVDVSVLPRFRT